MNCTAAFEKLSEHVSVVEIKELPEQPCYAKVTGEVRVPLKPPSAPATVPVLNGVCEITTAVMNILIRELNPATSCSEYDALQRF